MYFAQPLNKEKETFEEYFKFYENVLLSVSISIKTLEELTEVISFENPVLKELDELNKKMVDSYEEASKKYVAELLNNLLQYTSKMTFLRLGNIEIWVKGKEQIDSHYAGIEGGVREEYKIVRWVSKDEARGSN